MSQIAFEARARLSNGFLNRQTLQSGTSLGKKRKEILGLLRLECDWNLRHLFCVHYAEPRGPLSIDRN
jgi:hypothetical protein